MRNSILVRRRRFGAVAASSPVVRYSHNDSSRPPKKGDVQRERTLWTFEKAGGKVRAFPKKRGEKRVPWRARATDAGRRRYLSESSICSAPPPPSPKLPRQGRGTGEMTGGERMLGYCARVAFCPGRRRSRRSGETIFTLSPFASFGTAGPENDFLLLSISKIYIFRSVFVSSSGTKRRADFWGRRPATVCRRQKSFRGAARRTMTNNDMATTVGLHFPRRSEREKGAAVSGRFPLPSISAVPQFQRLGGFCGGRRPIGAYSSSLGKPTSASTRRLSVVALCQGRPHLCRRVLPFGLNRSREGDGKRAPELCGHPSVRNRRNVACRIAAESSGGYTKGGGAPRDCVSNARSRTLTGEREGKSATNGGGLDDVVADGGKEAISMPARPSRSRRSASATRCERASLGTAERRKSRACWRTPTMEERRRGGGKQSSLEECDDDGDGRRKTGILTKATTPPDEPEECADVFLEIHSRRRRRRSPETTRRLSPPGRRDLESARQESLRTTYSTLRRAEGHDPSRAPLRRNPR